MFKIVIDTCVWLDLAKDRRQEAVLGVVEEMVTRGIIKLIVPRIVLDEFRRNRERVAKEKCQSSVGPLPSGEGGGRKDRR